MRVTGVFFSDGRQLGLQKSLERGLEKGKLEGKIACNMLRKGMPVATINKLTQVSRQKLTALRKSRQRDG